MAITLPFVLIARPGKSAWRKLGLLSLFFFGLLLLVRIEIYWDFLQSPWQGMVLGAVYALLVILITKSAGSSGLTAKIDRLAWRDAIIATVLLLVFVVVRNLVLRNISPAPQGGTGVGVEFLLYQLTMPGIAEELAYRGVIQSRLNTIFPRPWKIAGAPLGWGFVITAILFWAVHAFRVEGLSLSFYWQTLTMQLIAGLVFGWLRERTDSILPGIIAHNLTNVVWVLT
jgi:membrane protease YdiL (CAAX protease family)